MGDKGCSQDSLCKLDTGPTQEESCYLAARHAGFSLPSGLIIYLAC